MWELVIALFVSTSTSTNFKVEIMPNKDTCMEVVKNFKFQTDQSVKSIEGISFVYCRPKQEVK